MGILQRISRALKRGPVIGGGTVGAQVDVAQIEAVEHQDFEDDRQRDDEDEGE